MTTHVLDDPLHGRHEIAEPVLVDLLNAPTVRRLEGIHQAGAVWLIKPERDVDRLAHSIGAMLIVRRLGGSLEEQAAALVHDTGHGVFSHVIDRVHDDETDAWHEIHGVELVMKTELPGLLARHGLDPEHLLVPHRWPLLDRPAPDLCADRIDYTLRDCLHERMIAAGEARAFLDALTVTDDGDIALTSADQAIWFAELFAELVREVFMDPIGVWADALLAEAIRDALDDGRITDDDLMLTDAALLERLAGDPRVLRLRPGAEVREVAGDSEVSANPKPRIVDPPVVTDTGLARASDIEPRLIAIADDIRVRSAAGVHVSAVAPAG